MRKLNAGNSSGEPLPKLNFLKAKKDAVTGSSAKGIYKGTKVFGEYGTTSYLIELSADLETNNGVIPAGEAVAINETALLKKHLTSVPVGTAVQVDFLGINKLDNGNTAVNMDIYAEEGGEQGLPFAQNG